MGNGKVPDEVLKYAIVPMKRFKSCLDFEKGISLVALIFSGSGEIPYFDILCSVALKTHFSLCSIKHDFQILFKTCPVRMSN